MFGRGRRRTECVRLEEEGVLTDCDLLWVKFLHSLRKIVDPLLYPERSLTHTSQFLVELGEYLVRDEHQRGQLAQGIAEG